MAQTTAPTFYDHLKSALEAYGNPARLGEVSPLAAPYFLGQALRGAAMDGESRGKALCNEIDRTVEGLWGESLPEHGEELLAAAQSEVANKGRGPRYDCLIFELNYFKRRFNPAPKSQSEIYNDILHISRASHDRYLREAVERLGTALLRRVRPALRLEQPTLTHELIGREALTAQILTHLRAGQSVSLTGPGGIGKSSLALAICEQWDTPSVFWFTIRPGVNDSLSGLLFALGYFLFQQGASTLWRQLIADGGQIKNMHMVSSLALTDLRTLTQRALLCFDEIDLLRRPALDLENPRHTQLLEFLVTAIKQTPLLLIGQQSVLETETIIELAGFDRHTTQAWLQKQQINFSQEDVDRLHFYTTGNPRLLELSIAFYLSSDSPTQSPTQSASQSLSQSLDQLPQSPALPALWHRLQRRLSQPEIWLLSALSVLRTPAPRDHWQREPGLGESWRQDEIERLLKRNLLRLDGQGGIYLLPALAEVIAHDLSVEQRQQFHLQAAHIFAQRAEYTLAANHLCEADRPAEAVTLWFPQRETEIQRGEAAAARTIFERVSLHRLDETRKQELALLRARLYELSAEPEKVTASLEAVRWSAENELVLDAAIHWGNALRAQGRSDAALEKYDQGANHIFQWLGKGTQLFVQRGLTHLRQREMQQATHSAKMASIQAERLQGAVEDMRGNYATAQRHYQHALTLATEIGDEISMAQIYHHLGIIASRQQNAVEAIHHFDQAMQVYARIGDRIRCEYVRGDIAAAYINSSQWQATIEPAQKALTFFQALGDSTSIALNASNLAEAHANLGNFEQARQCAELVLQQEEPHSHPYALFTLGTVEQKQQAWLKAELYLAQARQLAQNNDDSYLLAYAWRALGEVYRQTQKQEAAQHALQEALRLFQQLNLQSEIEKTNKLLSDRTYTRQEM